MQDIAFPCAAGAPAGEPGILRLCVTLVCAALLLTLVGLTFWYQDVRYTLPTPKPPSLVERPPGATVVLPASFSPVAGDQRLLFLHFFNPDCPCSRFNAEHVQALRARFGAQARFVAVVQTDEDQDEAHRKASLTAVSKLFGPDMEAVVDTGGRIAAACGVYSTPQAVILTAGASRTLLFRGNYNTSRYCADPATEFARLALTAIVNHQPLPAESRAALIAYGCELPANVAASQKR